MRFPMDAARPIELPALALKEGSRVRVRERDGTDRLYVVERVRPVSDVDSVLLVLRPDR